MKQTIFKKGDIVQAKAEWVAAHETQADTMGIVIDYTPENDLLLIGSLTPQDHALIWTFSGRGCFYDLANK